MARAVAYFGSTDLDPRIVDVWTRMGGEVTSRSAMALAGARGRDALVYLPRLRDPQPVPVIMTVTTKFVLE